MRLFIACELPADVRKSLAGIASGFSSGSARMKWVEEENLHVTMKFLGDVPDGKVEKVKDALGVVAFGRHWRVPPFRHPEGSLGGPGAH